MVSKRRPASFWLLTALMVAVVALFCRLALWQYHRAHEREALLAAAKAAVQGPTRPFRSGDVGELPRFARVVVEGRYDGAHQVLLEEISRPNGPGVGVDVLTPLRLDSGGLLMVNRGWVPASPEGRPQGSVAAPRGRVRISGYLDTLPQPGLRLGGDSSGKDNAWPRRLLYPSWRDLQRLYGRVFVHRVLLLAPGAKGGYLRAWRLKPKYGPQQNYGYMVQWLGFAVTVFIVWLVLTIRSRRRSGT